MLYTSLPFTPREAGLGIPKTQSFEQSFNGGTNVSPLMCICKGLTTNGEDQGLQQAPPREAAVPPTHLLIRIQFISVKCQA